jgi:hypothetical protein
MATTAGKSTQITNMEAVPVTRVHAVDLGGKLRVAYFDYTQSGAGDAGSTVELVKLPAGRIRVIGALSKIKFSAFGASRVLDIGYKAHTDIAGDAVAADDDFFATDVDVSSAGSGVLNEAGLEVKLFQSRDGVTVNCTVAGGTIPDGATLLGYVVFAADA